MVYLAGDNNLEGYGVKDLGEMKMVGSTDEIAIITQFDRMSDQVTRRYHLTNRPSLDADCVMQLPEVNTGDPNALSDFISWGIRTYPADRYGLVLWNHGSGWKDEDIYRIVRQKGLTNQVTRGQIRSLAAGKVSRALFKTSVEQLVVETAQTERAILFDDSSADFLDNIELTHVLKTATRSLGRPLDLLGFDACLMNMLEVHYQLHELCRVIVGSQEIEPGDGWPYDAVLAPLLADPNMEPEAVGQHIVDAYIAFYRTHHPQLPVTQSAVSMLHLKPAVQAVDGLAQAALAALANWSTLGRLFAALRSTQTFNDRDYIDLCHFCQLLAASDPNSEMGAAAQWVVAALTGATSPLIAAGRNGVGMDNAHGLSIYLPVRILSPLYARLDFANQYHWNDFLERFIHPT